MFQLVKSIDMLIMIVFDYHSFSIDRFKRCDEQ